MAAMATQKLGRWKPTSSKFQVVLLFKPRSPAHPLVDRRLSQRVNEVSTIKELPVSGVGAAQVPVALRDVVAGQLGLGDAAQNSSACWDVC